MLKTLMMTAALTLIAMAARGETYEVKMLNRGEAGAMVFEPAFVKAMPGDVIHFVATDKGHNVESIEGMLPNGVEPFKTKANADFDLTVEVEGVYGLKCTPHYGMGMVALLQVGAVANLDAASAVPQKGKAKARMAELFEQVE